jgi:hypothetical protein
VAALDSNGGTRLRTPGVDATSDTKTALSGRRLYGVGAACDVSAWCGAWCARWRQHADEWARRGEREAHRWDPATDFILN